jgi:hypothetical protein
MVIVSIVKFCAASKFAARKNSKKRIFFFIQKKYVIKVIFNYEMKVCFFAKKSFIMHLRNEKIKLIIFVEIIL